MADFAAAALRRDQLMLFPERLDQVIPADHAVRLLDEILQRIDWKPWESSYDLTCGQPPIHPRVLAGAILYRLLKRIRSSRGLEEAILVRNDLRWLVVGRSIDHTTLSKFRRK
jgi:transposase